MAEDTTTQDVSAKRPTPGPHIEPAPHGKVQWDNDSQDPTKRKHVGIDPDGEYNSTLFK